MGFNGIEWDSMGFNGLYAGFHGIRDFIGFYRLYPPVMGFFIPRPPGHMGQTVVNTRPETMMDVRDGGV